MINDNYLYSSAIVALMKGIVSHDKNEKVWNTIIERQNEIEDYINVMGLTLILHKDEGYAYLRHREYMDEEKAIPKLTSSRQLDFITSLSLVLLRKELIEIHKNANDERFIMSRQSFYDKMSPYLKGTNDEVKQKRSLNATLNKIEDMGFIKVLDNKEKDFEISLLVKSFMSAQNVENFDKKLEEYINHFNGEDGEE